MVDQPKVPLPGVKLGISPLVKAKVNEPTVNPITGKTEVNPLAPRPPEEIAAAQKVFDDSVVALTDATAGRNITNIPLSDPYWGAVHAHNVAYLALKDAVREIPISSPPDSDMKHDFKMAIESINAGEPRGTAMASILTGGVTVPVENIPETFQPFQRAQIPLGVKLVDKVEQPMEPAEIVIPIPIPGTPIPEEPPPPPPTAMKVS